MGMKMNNIRMTTRVFKRDLLAKLKENLAEHADIVKEANEGYIKKAQETLLEKLEKLKNGEVIPLSYIAFAVPVDYSDVYKAAIEMLEWNKDDEVILEADEFRQLVMDEWDWSDAFSFANSAYSKKAAAIREIKARR